MDDYELDLADRLGVISEAISEYGEKSFYLSFSGGRDSTALSRLLDLAVPGNSIPRVFQRTGMDYSEIIEFTKSMEDEDGRFMHLDPSCPIKPMLEERGYPIKSKEHSKKLSTYQKSGMTDYISRYVGLKPKGKMQSQCPDRLRYQFTPGGVPFRVSADCCLLMKERPLARWAKANGRPIAITGMMSSEGGQRRSSGCLSFKDPKDHSKGLRMLNPMFPLSDGWVSWFIEKEGIRICKLYGEPFRFRRTGCLGCPFSLDLGSQLETMALYCPKDERRAEIIFGKVYDEYRRAGYRLRKEGRQTLLF